LSKTKRASFLKEPSCSSWEEFFFLANDSMDRVGRDSLVLVLGKYGNTVLLDACVMQTEIWGQEEEGLIKEKLNRRGEAHILESGIDMLCNE
jgi:hypothetical protein